MSKGLRWEGVKLCFFFAMLFALCCSLLCSSSASAEGLSAWLNVNYLHTEQLEDGTRVSSSNNTFQNYYLRLDKSITPALSYQAYFRTGLTDSRSTDAHGNITDAYQRSIEPALDVSLRNPMYGLTAGYRRLEFWTTAHLKEESRQTTEFYYSRFDMTPYQLPSLSLQFDRQNTFDHLPVSKVDNSITT